MEPNWDKIGTIKGMNNLAGSMLASGKSPEEVLGALKTLKQIVDEIDSLA